MGKKRTNARGGTVASSVSKSDSSGSGKKQKRLKSTHVDSETSKTAEENLTVDAIVQKTVDASQNSEKWSKSKKKRMRKVVTQLRMAQSREYERDTPPAPNATKAATEDTTLEKSAIMPSKDNGKNKSSIQDGFKARLAGSRFRILNEELYTTTSQESFDRFTKSPELFEQYHEGYRHQVSSWPQNPVDTIVRSLTAAYAHGGNGKGGSASVVVADFGCGEAQLAKDLSKVTNRGGRGKGEGSRVFSVHSFDLVAPNELVTACDMARVPLEDKSVDVCVFCLSLMGTNLADFLREAHRVLKDDGRLKIAEVRSRIEYSHGRKGSTTDTEGTLQEFLDVLKQLGYDCLGTDQSNTMFLLLDLKKNGKTPKKTLVFSAKPCIYKRR